MVAILQWPSHFGHHMAARTYWTLYSGYYTVVLHNRVFLSGHYTRPSHVGHHRMAIITGAITQ